MLEFIKRLFRKPKPILRQKVKVKQWYTSNYGLLNDKYGHKFTGKSWYCSDCGQDSRNYPNLTCIELQIKSLIE